MQHSGAAAWRWRGITSLTHARKKLAFPASLASFSCLCSARWVTWPICTNTWCSSGGTTAALWGALGMVITRHEAVVARHQKTHKPRHVGPR